jgi:hypothetical protein
MFVSLPKEVQLEEKPNCTKGLSPKYTCLLSSVVTISDEVKKKVDTVDSKDEWVPEKDSDVESDDDYEIVYVTDTDTDTDNEDSEQ